MKTRTKTIIIASVAALFGSAAIAGVSTARSWGGHGGHDRGGMASMLFDQFDTNEDGSITKAEADAVNAERFQKFDADGNGQLSLQEFEPMWLDFMNRRMVASFQKLDNDGDAQVTRAEYDKRLNRMFSWIDRNGDDTIDRDDMRRGKWSRKGADAEPGKKSD